MSFNDYEQQDAPAPAADGLVPRGRYPMVVIPTIDDDGRERMAQWGVASTGTKQVLLYLEILEGPHAGQRLPWFGYFTRDSYQRTLESLRYCGWKSDDLRDLGALDQRVEGVVEHKTLEATQDRPARTVAQVGFINRPGGGGIKLANPMSDAELRDFASKMRGHAKQKAVVEGQRVERGKAPGAAPASNGRAPAPRNDDFGERNDPDWARGAGRSSAPAPQPQPAPQGREPGSDDDIPF